VFIIFKINMRKMRVITRGNDIVFSLQFINRPKFSFDLRSKASITSVTYGDVNHTMLNIDNRLQWVVRSNSNLNKITCGMQFNNKPHSANG